MLLNRAQAAEYLGISVRSLDRRAHEGRIPYISDRPGARVLYSRDALDRYIKKATRAHGKEVLRDGNASTQSR